MNKNIVIAAALFGMLAVVTGAFGAHGLKPLLKSDQLQVWHTAVQYQFYHVAALLFIALAGDKLAPGLASASYYLFVFGIILFSGSLYLLSCKDVLGWSWLKLMGPITPIGGLCFIAGWITLAFSVIRAK